MARQNTFAQFPGVSIKKGRNGEIRYQFRHKLSKDVTLKAEFGSEAFAREYDRLMDNVRAKQAAAQMVGIVAQPLPKRMEHIAEKTFRHAWVVLRQSLSWDGLKASTQEKNASHIEEFLQTRIIDDADVLWADAPMGDIEAEQLQNHYEAIYREFPAKAKHRVEAVRKLYDIAILKNWIKREQNKTKFLDMQPLPESDANRPWTDEEKEAYENRWALGTAPRTAYELAYALGARRGDLGAVGPRHVKNRVEYKAGKKREFRAIEWTAEKGRKGKNPTVVYHEITDRLEVALAALTHDMANDKPFLRKSNGDTYHPQRLSMRMGEWTFQAGLPKGLTLHGLRHTLGGELAEKGVSTKEIQLALGHRKEETTMHYTRRAKVDRVMANVAKVQNGDTDITIIRTVPNLKAVG